MRSDERNEITVSVGTSRSLYGSYGNKPRKPNTEGDGRCKKVVYESTG